MSITPLPNHEPNPYAAPKANLASPPTKSGKPCYRRGKLVIIPEGAALPPRCIHCNEPACFPLFPRSLYWQPAWTYWTLLGLVILFVFVYWIFGRMATVAPGFCRAHTARRKKIAWRTVGLGALSMACAMSPFYLLTLVGIFGGMTTLFLWAHLSNPLNPSLIDDEKVIVKGCGEPFLASLPTEPEPAS